MLYTHATPRKKREGPKKTWNILFLFFLLVGGWRELWGQHTKTKKKKENTPYSWNSLDTHIFSSRLLSLFIFFLAPRPLKLFSSDKTKKKKLKRRETQMNLRYFKCEYCARLLSFGVDYDLLNVVSEREQHNRTEQRFDFGGKTRNFLFSSLIAPPRSNPFIVFIDFPFTSQREKCVSYLIFYF